MTKLVTPRKTKGQVEQLVHLVRDRLSRSQVERAGFQRVIRRGSDFQDLVEEVFQKLAFKPLSARDKAAQEKAVGALFLILLAKQGEKGDRQLAHFGIGKRKPSGH